MFVVWWIMKVFHISYVHQGVNGNTFYACCLYNRTSEFNQVKCFFIIEEGKTAQWLDLTVSILYMCCNRNPFGCQRTWNHKTCLMRYFKHSMCIHITVLRTEVVYILAANAAHKSTEWVFCLINYQWTLVTGCTGLLDEVSPQTLKCLSQVPKHTKGNSEAFRI